MQHVATVLYNKQIAKSIFEMSLQCPTIASTAQPGQFAHIRLRNSIDPLLRRPISICDTDSTNGTVRLVYRMHGYGTEILSRVQEKDSIDLLAPLGNGQYPQDVSCKEVYLIGGGIGTPPLLMAAKKLASKGIEITTILGFACHDQVILEEDFKQYGNVSVYTLDGSHGEKGLVTDFFTNSKPQIYFACGPKPMLRALKEHSNFKEALGYLSFEEHMACGIGACMGCVTKVKRNTQEKVESHNENDWQYEKVCDCGPVFASDRVVF